MIDFADPTRSDISVLMFPDADSVTSFISTLDDSLNQIAVVKPEDPHYVDIMQRNKDYISNAITYPEVQQAGVDLSSYVSAIS